MLKPLISQRFHSKPCFQWIYKIYTQSFDINGPMVKCRQGPQRLVKYLVRCTRYPNFYVSMIKVSE